MNEPTGRRIDGTPWEEARPPHLPDAVVRLSPWTFAFLAVTLLHLGLAFQAAMQLGPLGPPDAFLRSLEAQRSAIIASLFGVALFVRHPDARRALPLLAFGAALFSLSTLLGVVADPVTRFLTDIAPVGDEGWLVSPAVAAWSVFTTLVSVFAVVYTAAGLAAARRRPPIRAARTLAVGLTVVAVLTTAVALIGIEWAESGISPSALISLALGLGLALASTLAWSYLLVVSLSGLLGGEAPRLGWAAATLAAVLFLAIRIVIALPLGAVVTSATGSAVIAALDVASLLSWLMLLVAFALGLPATVDRPAATPPGSAGS